ncbi:MAG TPA: prolyl oligopeptidase family serine peptidase [Casimicrobiaceae bacterium]|nr:prolyl oligopeptidase family serine peptidase [Casimicrobiaceae bacterium]
MSAAPAHRECRAGRRLRRWFRFANNAQKIKAPLFVVAGLNDPRVRYTEAEQIMAAARKNGVPVWYLLADNEGHGFARKANADFLFHAMAVFFQERLLRAH